MRIAYDGVSLENGSMDVKELSPALFAFAELVERANEIIGNEQKVNISLKADCIKQGSFDVSLDVAYSVLEQAKILVGCANGSGLTELMSIIGWTVTAKDGGNTVKNGVKNVIRGVFKLIKIVRNRPIESTTQESDGITKIYFKDGDVVETDRKSFELYLDHKARKNIEKVVKPVRQKGIDSFELRDAENLKDKMPIEKITKDELVYFKSPETDSIDNTSPTRMMILKIVALSFEEDNKWRFSDGEKIYWMTIDDKEFISKVKSRELSFSSGDMLNVEYIHRQIVYGSKIDNIYTITKVIGKVETPKQIRLI